MKFAFIIVTRATNCGALLGDVLFRSQWESLPGAFSRNFATRAGGAGRESFASPAGGLRRCREFRILFENASLFRGKLINAGLAYLESHFIMALSC